MASYAIDLAAPFFWLFLGAAVLLLTPLAHPSVRRVALALVNLIFIAILLGLQGAAAVLVFCLLIHGASSFSCRTTLQRSLRWVVLGLCGIAILWLFYFHKTGSFQLPVQWKAREFLAGVGFSYVALRALEYLRAGAEGRTNGFDWIDAVRYLVPFHMLAAGPIQSWDDFRKQPLVPSSRDSTEVLGDFERIVRGLFKKFVLARAIEVIFLTGFQGPWPYLILETQFYYLWVFLDFSAYSDIAVGAGRLMGIATPENFNNPLGARNMIAFWERWHISLSTFIRRNVFLPIQLNLMRTSEGAHPLRAATIGLLFSFLLCGLWHGLSPKFLLWGAFHAVAVILCNSYKFFLGRRLGKKELKRYLENPAYRILATVITFEFVAVSLAFLAYPATKFLE